MSNQVELDHKTQQASEEVCIIPSGEEILAQLGIDSITVKTMKQGIKRSYYRAVINWLTKYKANPDASNLEKVKGLLEAFYHLCEVEDWDKAGKIIFMTLKTPTSEELHNQMQTWGYSQQVINIYNNLLGKLSPKEDTIFYNGLGNVYLALGYPHQSLLYYQQQLDIAHDIKDQWIEGTALLGLGNSFYSLGDFQKATSHYLNSQKIAIKVNNPKSRRIALAGLGDVQIALGQYQIALEYYKQQLELAIEIGERLGEGDALGRIGNAYYLLKDFKTALDYHQQSLIIALAIGDKHGEARTLGNIGITYHSLQEYKLAANYHCQFLRLSCDIGLKLGEGEALINWSITHRELKEYSEALEKLNEALTIFQAIQLPIQQARVLKNLAEIHQILGEHDEATITIDQALEIANNYNITLTEECQKLKRALDQKQMIDDSVGSQKFLMDQIREQNRVIEFLMTRHKGEEISMNEAKENLVNVLVITALKDELDAFLVCDNESGQSWQKLKDSLKYPYYKKSFRHSNGKLLTIAAARPVEMGEYSTSILATRLVSELKPSCLAMIGVCAGNKKDVFLGDVIVANRVFKFDFGKLIAYYESESKQKIRTEEIFHDIRTYNLKRLWESSIQDFSKEWIDSIQTQRPKSYHHQERWLLHKLYNYREYPSQNINPSDHPERAIECPDWKKIIERLREKELLRTESFELTEKGIREVKEDKLLYLEDERYKDCLTPALHLGVIATTSSIQKDPELFSRLEKLQRRVYGVEMEGAVIGAVAEIHEIPMIVVKSVQDYADYDKNDQFRLYAAETSARFLLDFLKRESI